MRVLVCGGRDYDVAWHVFDTLQRMHGAQPFTFLMTGGARGADNHAVEWAKQYVPFRVFLPNWIKHGTAAGPIRNQQMLDEGKPDVVVAFPGGKGTADMVQRAKKPS